MQQFELHSKTVLLYNEMIMIGIFVSCSSWRGKRLLNHARFVAVTITGQV